MANGTLAASQLEMLSQSGTGIMTVVPPATNTNQTLTLPDSTGTVATLGTSLTLATAVTASGTSVDFTGIPSWVKRITVMFSGVSTNGTSAFQIQLGDAGGFETSGYLSTSSVIASTSVGAVAATSGFLLTTASTGTDIVSGLMSIVTTGTNNWVYSSVVKRTSAITCQSGGDKTLSDTLTQVRITTFNGTDTFDAGTINILYEG
jgi:hypothetical protein